MQNNGNLVAVVPVLKDVINSQTSGSSVVSSPEGASSTHTETHQFQVGFGNSAAQITSSGPETEPEVFFIGTGEAKTGFVFTQQPDAFVPQWVGRGSSVGQSLPSPGAPRRCSCSTTYLQGVSGENVQNRLVWAPPLTDSSGRWLESSVIDRKTAATVFADTLLYYLVQREDLNTGEVATMGMVAHSRQVIHSLRTFLEAEHAASRPGAVTDYYTSLATFDPSLYQTVLDINGNPVLDGDSNPIKELVMPSGHEEYFEFLDTTAIYGHSYKYMITAISSDQREGMSVSVIPGDAQAAGGTEVAFAPAWCSTYPVIGAGATGSESYLDLTIQAGSLITDLDIALIPIQDNVLNIDTSAPGANEPAIIETNPAEILLYVGSVSSVQNIQFVGRNIELCGGISTVTISNGITLHAGSVQKTRIETTDDWKYTISVDVAPTATVGVKTMTITCVNNKTVMCSQIKAVAATGSGTEGPTFDDPDDTYRFTTEDLEISFVIAGKNMGSITGFTATPNKTTVTVSNVSANAVMVSCTPFVGIVYLTPTLSAGKVRTMKDGCHVSVTPESGGDPDDPSSWKYKTNRKASTLTLRSL